MKLKTLLTTICMTVGALVLTAPAFAEPDNGPGEGSAIVTVLSPKNFDASAIIAQDSLKATVNGKESEIVGWTPLRAPDSVMELVILIDGSARSEIGLKLDDIAGFIRDLPGNAKVAIGYMDAGRAVLSGRLTTDRALAIQELRIPAGIAGSSASPYFCLSDLAKKWPSDDSRARREVIMITDGVDNYIPEYDPNDPYVQASIRDSIRAGLVVYSIYTPNRGDSSNSGYQSFVGQSLLAKLTDATGGYTYWDGTGRNPVSYSPYLSDIALRLENQYQLKFQVQSKTRDEFQSMRLKTADKSVDIFAPQRVSVSYRPQ